MNSLIESEDSRSGNVAALTVKEKCHAMTSIKTRFRISDIFLPDLTSIVFAEL